MHDPRRTRLQSDFDKVRAQVDGSDGTLVLVRTVGTPPISYVIEYHCPSLVKTGTAISTRHVHQVEINLSANYPFEKPAARMLTPVFNPHVFSSSAICLGSVWSPAETLDVLILKIGALLQLDPRVLDPNSPANGEANLWVQQNRQKIPLGKVSFTRTEEPKPRIQWL